MRNCNTHLYADDTVLYCTSNTVHSVTEILQQAFDNLQHLLFNLKLILTQNKMQYMIFLRARNIADDGLHIITLTGHSFERVSEYKYLGIWLDQKLTFKFHIDILASKLKQKTRYLGNVL